MRLCAPGREDLERPHRRRRKVLRPTLDTHPCGAVVGGSGERSVPTRLEIAEAGSFRLALQRRRPHAIRARLVAPAHAGDARDLHDVEAGSRGSARRTRTVLRASADLARPENTTR